MKKCAVINDLSGFGKCSLTAVLSNQTAYESFKALSLTDTMKPFIEEWKKLGAKFDGILTGFVTDKAQLETLKEILQIPAVNYFEADIKLKFQKKRGILDVSGQVRAGLGLISVISLEPFDRAYKTDFALTFDTNATYEQIRELDEDIEADIPDIVIGGRIDLGDIAIEQLALVMEDHPRQDGEEFSPLIEDDAPLRENPFAILSKLKK